MPNTASRLSANGSLTINGSFDEVTRIVPNGLILYYDAGKSYSSGFGNIVYDLSSSNNQGIIAGSSTNSFGGATNPVYASANSGYFILNGNGGYITSSTLYSNPSEFSIGVWFRTATTTRASKLIGYGNSQYQNSFAGGTTFETSYDRHLWMGADNRVYFGIYPGQVVSINSSSTYTDNVWHYAVGTFSGSQSAMRLYVDGALIGSNTQFNLAQAYNGYWKIGTGSIGGWPSTSPGSSYFLGDIGPATVYNRALTAQEVLQNYNVDAVRFGRTATPYSVNKLTANTLFITNEYDEVTYNPSANVRVNTLSNSQQFDLAPWGVGNASVTANVEKAPDGTRTAYALNDTAVTSEHLLAQARTGQNETMTASYYAKAAARTRCYISLSNYISFSCQVHYDLIAGTITLVTGNNSDYSNISGTITPVGDGWFRCTLTATKGSVNNTNSFTIAPVVGSSSVYLGTGATAIYIWGAQYEVANSPSIYVRTGTNAIIANTFNQRTVNTGNTYIRGIYDEVSNTLPIEDSSLIVNLDPSYDISYSGTGTVCYDISGNKNHATLNGSITFDTYNSAFNLNGGYLSIPTSASLNTISTAVTASVWVNPTQFISGNFSRIISRDSFPTQSWYIEQGGGVHANKGSIFSYDGRAAVSGPVLSTNTWYNITMTSTNTVTSLYVNGNLHGSTATSTFRANTAGIGVGADANGGSSLLCKIGTVQVYNRALTAAEISTNVNAQRRRYGI